jgi:malate synthase
MFEITSEVPSSCKNVLSAQALDFLVQLHRTFNARREELLRNRAKVQKDIDAGHFPDFLPETKSIRQSEWKIGSTPSDLLDRRVEITGPVDRKMVINALNSGAKVFMADFEDAHSPTWVGTLEGQVNLQDAIRRTITYKSPEGKNYSLGQKPAVLIARPRGLHLEERHLQVDGKSMSGSLFDFGLYFFHNAVELLKRGSGPYFYIPKLESHLEARFWSEVFAFSEKALALPKGSIKATVLIETILAAFEMDEILYELKDNIVGLNCGRWDYIFSFIKKFRNRPEFLFPDRSQITMTTHFLKSYSQLLIQTCHRRGAHAMGGMAAQIPIKNDPELNRVAMDRVRADKEREVRMGHDGTWVSHPGMVPIAMEIFDAHMKEANQIQVKRDPVEIRASDLLTVPEGKITSEGLRMNVNVSLLYMEAWLRGIGCVPLYNLMEDAATAEISRAQVWHWIRHPMAKPEDGEKITLQRVLGVLAEETARAREMMTGEPTRAKLKLATEILDRTFSEEEFGEFITLEGYRHI